MFRVPRFAAAVNPRASLLRYRSGAEAPKTAHARPLHSTPMAASPAP